ncbi:UDP-N-acetylglucosamine 2-epimerase [Leptospira stimsonii]|uniref:UDP-N-acetylglucosamine 2-epimerase (Hydrolyzing) n=1 Tax=Leptospira stimsonii TaxID=2202203 RepID=A0ABY2MVY0_9LEPT|nr:UDP-N-acetylglucosamine 2-epimerase [Leptospira stimsonii]TGK14572.1 UDP-N-acetylglucosamine 2-epimerase (hydrolyzing) [Leptospira stimsonii]TGM09995.1 UDP-N-acetylglucosamine 2-epimerase (hydrolyzing) [Leptospira stimsonii]
MKRKVSVVTGTRAEYGLLRLLIKKIQDSKHLELQLVVTGMHLSPEFGSTYQEIESDGFSIDKKVEMLMSADSSSSISKSIGLGIIGFADVWRDLEPDLIILLGDRFEIFAAASSAMVSKLPIAHIHGGEKTEGAFDESIRHCITKMSHLHFVATEEYRKRVIQLGESPEHVFNVGGFGVDAIRSLKLMTRSELETSLNYKFGEKNLLVTFHPVTLEKSSSKVQMKELLDALKERSDVNYIFTMPNADSDSRVIFNMIEEFVNSNSNAVSFSSLGQLRYFSTLAQVDGVVGNSSSGILEAPTFFKGTVNIGDRQKGRLRAGSVIDCEPERKSILSAISRLYSQDFQNQLESIVNPYGLGGASDRMIQILEKMDWKDLLKKRFYDVNF